MRQSKLANKTRQKIQTKMQLLKFDGAGADDRAGGRPVEEAEDQEGEWGEAFPRESSLRVNLESHP